jgi:hypothetical protein
MRFAPTTGRGSLQLDIPSMSFLYLPPRASALAASPLSFSPSLPGGVGRKRRRVAVACGGQVEHGFLALSPLAFATLLLDLVLVSTAEVYKL